MVKVKITTREVLPSGVYPAHMSGIEERVATDGSPYWLWKFTVNHGGRIIERTAPSSTNFGPKAKARQWAEALMGGKIEGDQSGEFDLDQLVGRASMVVLNVVERDGERFNNVTQVLPPTSA